MRINTGIKGLDTATNGGIVKDSIVLLSGGSGTGKTIIAAQFLLNGAKNHDENGLFITIEEGRANILNCLPDKLGKDVKAHKDDVWFLDLSTMRKLKTATAGHDPETDQSSVLRVEVLMEVIQTWAKDREIKRLVIDGIASLGLFYGCENEFRDALFKVVSLLKSLGITAIITTEINAPDRISRLGVEEFVTDAIITLENDSGRRSLNILKMRGANFLSGPHSFEISDDGVTVYPKLPIEKDIPPTTKKIKTGIKGLDKMSFGGFFEGDAILISGSAGTGKTTFGLQFINEGAKKGKKCLFIGFEENPSELKRNAKNIGIDFAGFEKKGLVKIMHSTPAYVDKNKHSNEIREALDGVERVVIDTVTDYQSIVKGPEYKEFLTSLIFMFKKRKITSVLTAETAELMGITKLMDEGTSHIVDGIIMMRYVEIGSEMKKAMNILKLRGTTHEQEIRQYETTSKGVVIEHKFEGMEGVLTGSPRKSITEKVEKFFG